MNYDADLERQRESRDSGVTREQHRAYRDRLPFVPLLAWMAATDLADPVPLASDEEAEADDAAGKA